MMKKLFSAGTLALATLTIVAGPAPTEWNVDVPHSGIGFTVNHFFTPVQGEFDDYRVELIFDRENPADSRVDVRIDVASIDTGNERRDDHLLSADFFDAERYPYITFTSSEVVRAPDGGLLVQGPLTIKDRTQVVQLPISVLGVKDIPTEMQEMLGGVQQVASFQTDLRIDRSDFGVGAGSWAAAVIVGHEVDIDIAVEANR